MPIRESQLQQLWKPGRTLGAVGPPVSGDLPRGKEPAENYKGGFAKIFDHFELVSLVKTVYI